MGVNGGPVRWCQEHGEQLDRVAREFQKRKPTQKAVKPKPATGPADPLGRLPLEVRVKRLANHVHAVGAPITRAEAAKAAGLTSTAGSLRRILKAAEEAGLVEVQRGKIAPGSKVPVAS